MKTMKREIKFRCLIPSVNLGWNTIYFVIGEPLAHYWKDKKNIFSQHTGLKDKNGKEIYEGDLVSLHAFGFDGNETEHEWKLCQVSVSEMGTELNLYDEESYKYNCSGPIALLYGLHEESFEVIGNIYENPELLKQ